MFFETNKAYAVRFHLTADAVPEVPVEVNIILAVFAGKQLVTGVVETLLNAFHQLPAVAPALVIRVYKKPSDPSRILHLARPDRADDSFVLDQFQKEKRTSGIVIVLRQFFGGLDHRRYIGISGSFDFPLEAKFLKGENLVEIFRSRKNRRRETVVDTCGTNGFLRMGANGDAKPAVTDAGLHVPCSFNAGFTAGKAL